MVYDCQDRPGGGLFGSGQPDEAGYYCLVLFIATIGLFLGFILWNQRVLFYRERYEAELNRLALFKHFDYILKFANDIIFLLDKDLNIVEANDRALENICSHVMK